MQKIIQTSLFPIAVFLITCNPAAGSEVDFQQLYTVVNESARLWKEKAERLEADNRALRKLLKERETQPQTQSIVESVPEPKYEEFHIEIPSYGVSNIASYGGPNVKINIWNRSVAGVVLQVGSAAKHNVEVPLSGRALLYRDTVYGDEVYLTNKIASQNMVKLLVRRRVR